MTDIVTETDPTRLRSMDLEDRCSDAALLINAAGITQGVDAWEWTSSDLLAYALSQLLFPELDGCQFIVSTATGALIVVIDGPESIIHEGREVHLGSPDIPVHVGWPHRRCDGEDVQDALHALHRIMHPGQ